MGESFRLFVKKPEFREGDTKGGVVRMMRQVSMEGRDG